MFGDHSSEIVYLKISSYHKSVGGISVNWLSADPFSVNYWFLLFAAIHTKNLGLGEPCPDATTYFS